MSWNPLTTANVTSGKPWTTSIATKIKDCLEYLYSVAGASGAILQNGGFELDSDADGVPDSWTKGLYPGGAGALYTTTPAHGAQSWSFTHPGGAGNGGGSLTSGYVECSEYRTAGISLLLWATAAGMKNIIQIQYYTKAKVANGAVVTLGTITSNPATPTRYGYEFTPPADSRYYKLILIGGYTDTDVAGTAYFDDVTQETTESYIGAAAVSQAKLKTSTGEVSVTAASGGAGGPVSQAANSALPGGQYGFYPQVKAITTAGTLYSKTATAQIANVFASESYVTNMYLKVDIDAVGASQGAAYAIQRYVTSSGEVFWIFMLRDISTKQVIMAWAAPDHPCMGNGGKPLVVSHPFGNYDQAKYEIIVVTPNESEINELSRKAIEIAEDKPDRSILQVIMEDYEIDEKGGAPDWPLKAVTVGLPPGTDWQRQPEGTLFTPIKKVIPDVGFTRRTLRVR